LESINPRPCCHGPLPFGTPGIPGTVGTPDILADTDQDRAECARWLDGAAAVVRDPAPRAGQAAAWESEPWEPDAWDLDDPDDGGLVRPRFGQGREADLLAPGPHLTGLTEEAVLDLGCLSDNELIGVLQATRRQIAREQFKQVLVTAEFGRRRQAAFQDAAARGMPVGCRPGGFPGEELAAELVTSRIETGHRIDDALDLTTRLPATLAGMAAGQIDAERAGWIAMYTRSLTPADAARADEVLAEAAPDLRVEQVARKAAALEMKLNPDAVAARKEHARRSDQRVEARRELSGNASLSGRELDTTDVMASKAYIDAIALKLRDSGLFDGTLDRLRALAMTDLTQGRNPLDRIKPVPAPARAAGAGPADDPSGPAALDPGTATSPDPRDRLADGHDDQSGGASGRPGEPVAHPAPLPAFVNLLVPVGTLLGWSATPGQAGAWGLLDRDETRAIATAAAGHPATRWCVTLTGPDGTALAHGCARGPRPRLLSDLEPQQPPAQLTELLRRLNPAFTPIASGSCDHAEAKDGYAPSRKLRHLVRARSATCDAPGCQAQAMNSDLDHTRPWPDGATEQCNLAPRCRTHHRAKQAPDWKVEQAGPGVTQWTLPSGRIHITAPTTYDT